MKLAELLTEWKLAPVHTNKKQSLSVIANLVQRDFAIPTGENSCLLAQAIFSASAVSGIPADVITNALSVKHARKYRPELGHTLESIINGFNKAKIQYNGQIYRFNVGVKTYDNIDQAMVDVKRGQPVVAMVATYGPVVGSIVYDLPHKRSQGIIPSKAIDVQHEEQPHVYHAVLLIGYDSATEHVIFRDTDPQYSYKGYGKIDINVLRKRKKLVSRYMSIIVNDAQTKPINTQTTRIPK